MSGATTRRTPKSGRYQSLFFQDLASPVSARRGKFSSPGEAAAVSSLWRDNFGNSELPPPPIYTLEDRSDFSPESGIPDFPLSPEPKSDPRTPLHGKGEAGGSTSSAMFSTQHNAQRGLSISGCTWWSPGNKSASSDQEDKGKGSPVEGVVQPGALIMLPPPREVARPEMQRIPLSAGNLDEEEWVTVYGFSPGDTNLVLREFEKYGVILKHVLGPRDSNWMHILYQNRSAAQKALNKNGTQLNAVLIVGVKPVDPIQRQALNERPGNSGFMTLAARSRQPETNGFQTSRTYNLQSGNNITRQSGGAIASPAKSVVSKIVDLMFGV